MNEVHIIDTLFIYFFLTSHLSVIFMYRFLLRQTKYRIYFDCSRVAFFSIGFYRDDIECHGQLISKLGRVSRMHALFEPFLKVHVEKKDEWTEVFWLILRKTLQKISSDTFPDTRAK